MKIRTRQAIGKQNRAKGAAFEREVAAALAPLFPGVDVRRNIAQARTAKREGCDIEGTPWWIETKCGASFSWSESYKQACADCDERAPFVIGKRPRTEAMVYGSLADFGDIYAGVKGDPDELSPLVTMRLADFVYMAGLTVTY